MSLRSMVKHPSQLHFVGGGYENETENQGWGGVSNPYQCYTQFHIA